MFIAIISILSGVLISFSVIIAKKPNVKELLDKIIPYQSWIGAILIFLGSWSIIQSILNLTSFNIFWVIVLLVSVFEFIIRFIFGDGLISKYLLEKNKVAKEKTLHFTLLKNQVSTGFMLIYSRQTFDFLWSLENN